MRLDLCDVIKLSCGTTILPRPLSVRILREKGSLCHRRRLSPVRSFAVVFPPDDDDDGRGGDE